MASNHLLTVLLVLVSVFLTSGHSLSTRDAVMKQDDESYLMATGDQGTLMIVVEDQAKARSLQALVTGSKVVAVSKESSSTGKQASLN
ncbi:unnamed protein product [Microthlaspi erraticum]|uniref:Uncharacterized protein n=1 Tax=Microthlaspi erraticum TaxID=1685480 RepID=A0A6D2IIE1_9BRAS|nr:unnamed protein product [Microthlaspi erraticum]